MKRVLVMPLFGIGDTLMCTPALRNLKESGADVTFLHMFRATYDIMQNNPHVDDLVYFPLTERKLAGVKYLLGLRGRFDASINFYPSNKLDYSLASFLAGAEIRIGHRYRESDIIGANFLNNKTLMEDDSLHNVQENLRLLGLLDINDPRQYSMQVFLVDDERDEASKWLDSSVSTDELVGIHAGSSVYKSHAGKRWPAQKFAEFIKELRAARPSVEFLLFGGAEEKPLKDRIIDMAGASGYAHTVETDGIRQTAAIMERCGAMLTNDSGLMHLAAALGVATAALFGPTNPLWLHPWQVAHKVLRHDSCEPCFRYSPEPVRCKEMDFQCLQRVEVREVIESVDGLLS